MVSKNQFDREFTNKSMLMKLYCGFLWIKKGKVYTNKWIKQMATTQTKQTA